MVTWVLARPAAKPPAPIALPKVAMPAAPQPKEPSPPPAPLDGDAMVKEARKRAEQAAQGGDRISMARARVELAIVLEIVQRDFGAAVAEYRAAHAMAPAALAPIAGARRLTPLRPLAPAMALLEGDVRATSDPRTKAARLMELGRVFGISASAPDKTCQTFRDLLEIEPANPGALRGLEAALRAMPRGLDNAATAEALVAHLEAMATAWKGDPRLSAWLCVERALLLEKMHRTDAARAAFETAMELDGGVGPVREMFVRHLVVQKSADRLVELWTAEAAMETDPDRAARLLYAAGRLASEHLDQAPIAIDLHGRAAALEGAQKRTRLAALRELVRLHEAAANVEGAVNATEKMLALVDTDAAQAHLRQRLTKAQETLGRWEDVAAHSRALLAAVPDDQDARERLDRALSRLGRHEQRISMWTAEASRLVAPSARADVLLRAARIAEGDMRRPDMALVELRAAWAVDPSNIEVCDSIARLLTPATPPNSADPDDPSRARARIDFYSESAAATEDPSRKIAHLEKLAQIWEDEVRNPQAALDVYNQILAIESGRRSAVLGIERNAGRCGDMRELFRALVLEADQAKSPALERGLLLRAAEIASERLNDADTALDLVRRVLAKNAGDPLALRTACRVHERTGRFDETLAQLKILLLHSRKGPAAFGVAIDIAVLLEEQLRRRDEAVAAYREANRIDPSHPQPIAGIRRLLMAAGEHQKLADELVAMASGALDHAHRAALLCEAAEIYDDRLDDLDHAVPLLVQARALEPDDEAIAERLERAYVRQNKVGDLVAQLDGMAKSAPRARTLFALGSWLADDRDLVRATSILEQVLAEDQHHVAAARLLEQIFRRTEQWPKLAEALRAQALAFESADARVGALSELLLIEEYRGIPAPAGEGRASDMLRLALPDDLLLHESIVRKALGPDAGDDRPSLSSVVASLGILAAGSADPHHAAALQLMAALLLERGGAEDSPGEALRRYRFVLDAWPECLTAARGVRRLAERLGDQEAVVESSIALGNLDGEPGDRAERLMEAANALLARNAPVQKVQVLLARALAEDPSSARAAHGLVSLVDRGADVGPCVDALRLALERTPEAAQAIMVGTALAHIALEHLHDPTVALEALRRIRRKAPGHVPTLLTLAETSAALGLFAEAAELATSATGITQDPGERIQASVILAEAHAQLPDMHTAARRDVQAAHKRIQEAPASAQASYLVRLARAHVCLSEVAEAEEALMTAVLTGGSDPGPAAELARLYDTDTSDGATAYAAALSKILARAATSKIPVDPGWLIALGRIEATHLDKPREGVARIREAIRIEPGRIEAYEALANVYGAMGAHEDAAAQLFALLGEMAPASATPERLTGLLDLMVGQYGAAHRTLQAGAAEELAAYVRAKDVEGSPAPRRRRLAPTAPVPLSLTAATITTALLPATARGVHLETAALLGEVSLKVLRFDPALVNLSARDRLPPRSAHPLRMLADRLAMAFGDLRFDLHAEAASVSVPRILPGDPPAIVLPKGYGGTTENEQAVGLARVLFYLALGIPWVEELGIEDLDGVLVGAFRTGDEDWRRGMLAPARNANADAWRSRIARAAGRKLKRALEDNARRARSDFDPAAWRHALRLGSFRAAYILTGDLASTLDHAWRVEQTLGAVPRGQATRKLLENPVTRDVILYALSSEPTGLRRSAGTA